jgi:hypothetical protein
MPAERVPGDREPLSKPQHLTESNSSSVSSIARVIAAGEASRGLRSSWLRLVIFSVIGLCAALWAELTYSEKKVLFIASKQAVGGILAPARRPGKLRLRVSLCIFVATDRLQDGTLERRQMQWRSDSF